MYGREDPLASGSHYSGHWPVGLLANGPYYKDTVFCEPTEPYMRHKKHHGRTDTLNCIISMLQIIISMLEFVAYQFGNIASRFCIIIARSYKKMASFFTIQRSRRYMKLQLSASSRDLQTYHNGFVNIFESTNRMSSSGGGLGVGVGCGGFEVRFVKCLINFSNIYPV